MHLALFDQVLFHTTCFYFYDFNSSTYKKRLFFLNTLRKEVNFNEQKQPLSLYTIGFFGLTGLGL